jgi:hypothetical protein
VEAPDFLDLLCSVPLQLLQGPAEVRTLILEQEMGRLMDEESDADGLDSEDELRIFDTKLAQTDHAPADTASAAAAGSSTAAAADNDDAMRADAASSDSDAAAAATAGAAEVQSKADRKAEKKAKKADKKAAKAAATVAAAAPVLAAPEQDEPEVQLHKSKRSKRA